MMCLSKHQRLSGSALVITLLLIVLLTAAILAFFSRATLGNQIAQSRSGAVRAGQIAKTAIAFTTADLISEMRAGSEGTPLGQFEELQPRADSQGAHPTMRPARTARNPGITNLLKGSFGGELLWPSGALYGNQTAPVRAFSGEDNLTTTAARNRRFIRASRWGVPRLHDDDAQLATGTFTPPSWVLVTRDGGAVNASGASPDFAAWSNPQSQSYVTGRYAAMVYDVGGLLNVNVAGTLSPPVPAERAARGGRAPFADLTALGGDVNPTAFLNWRDRASLAGNYTTRMDDPQSDFRWVAPGNQGFPTRQDLIRATDTANGLTGTPLPARVLPELTVFSRGLNAPGSAPDPARPRVDRSGRGGPDDEMNPAPLRIRVDGEFPRRDGSTARTGEPLMKTRFPLGKLSLLKSPSNSVSDPQTLEDIRSWFGLEPAPDGYSWQYVNAPNFLNKLKDLPGLRREPDFFEVLQAAILAGSLGAANNAETSVRSRAVDANAFYQVMQIGANLIDQADEDNLPTRILFNNFPIVGVENLPYICAIPAHIIRPAPGFLGQPAERNLVMGWYQFGLWNPHQNAVQISPSNAQNLRLRAVSGKAGVQLTSSAAVVRQQNPFWDFASNPAGFTFRNNRKFGELAFLDRAPLSDPDPDGLPSFEVAVESSQGSPNNIVPNMPRFAPDSRPGFAGFYVGAVDAPEPPTYVDGNGTTRVTLDEGGRFQATWTTSQIVVDPVDPPVFQMEVEVSPGVWIAYQTLDGLLAAVNGTNTNTDPTSTSPVWGTGGRAFFQFINFNGSSFRPMLGRQGILSIDPRSLRFGMYVGQNVRQMNRWDAGGSNGGYTMASYGTASGQTQEQKFLGNSQFADKPRPTGPLWKIDAGAGYRVSKIVDNVETDSVRVEDPDRVVRPGDGNSSSRSFPSLFTNPQLSSGAYQAELNNGNFPALFQAPLDTNYISHRSVLLNRPFRNVGEMGYAFRGQPWKTLDFSSARSADLGLLDYFSVEENRLIAGPVDLNTRNPRVLAAVLSGIQSLEMFDRGTTPAPLGSLQSKLSAANAAALAQTITNTSLNKPFRNHGDFVKALAGPAGQPNTPLLPIASGDPVVKAARETALRAVSSSTQTRVWNLMIDVIAQAGRFPRTAERFSDFVVEGETRVWLHLAIDRLTGEVLDSQVEVVNE